MLAATFISQLCIAIELPAPVGRLRRMYRPSSLGSGQRFAALLALTRNNRLADWRHNQPPAHVDLPELQTSHQPIEQLVIQIQRVRDPVGFTRIGLVFGAPLSARYSGERRGKQARASVGAKQARRHHGLGATYLCREQAVTGEK